MLTVLDTTHDFPLGSGVAGQLVGVDHSRDILQPFEQLSEELLGRMFAASALDQDIQNIAVLIDSSPEVVRLAVDLEVHFIQVPLVSRFWATMFQLIGVRLAKFQTPLSDGFVGQHDPTLGHDLFDITETQGEAEAQPDAMANNLSWEA